MYGMPAGLEDEFDSDDEFMLMEDYARQDDFKKFDVVSNEQIQIPSLSDPEKDILNNEMSLKSEDMRVAITKGNKDYVQQALYTGYEADQPLHDGWTALMCACFAGFPEIVKVLLENNASPNFNKDMFTPLFAVCISSKCNEDDLVKCAELLLKHDAKINAHDRHMMTPLMYGSKMGFAKVVELLCRNNADLNKQETRGWTAVMFAASNGFSHVVRVLLEHKADITITTLDGQRPTDIAFENGFTMLADLLDKYDGSTTEEFQKVPKEVSCLTTSSSSSSKYVKYGDLELFLYGLELGHLIKHFQEHKLEFKDLLVLSDQEMLQIGITQLGVRKKLLNAIHDVHTNQWKIDILPSTQISKLTLLDSTVVITNITKHLTCVQSSVRYLNQLINQKSKDLAVGDVALQKALLEQCGEAFQVSDALQHDLQKLTLQASVIFPNADQKPVNLIQRTTTSKDNKPKSRFIMLCLAASLLFGTTVVGYKALQK